MQKDPKIKKFMVMAVVVILHVALLSIIWIFSGAKEDPEDKDGKDKKEHVDTDKDDKDNAGDNNGNGGSNDNEPTFEEYIVKKGDLLSVIAYRLKKKYELEKLSTAQFQKNIMEANNITNPNRIRIGQKLKIPIKE